MKNSGTCDSCDEGLQKRREMKPNSHCGPSPLPWSLGDCLLHQPHLLSAGYCVLCVLKASFW